MFLFRKGVYRSDEPTPSLSECLANAEFAVRYLYAARVEKEDEAWVDRAIRASHFLREMDDWLKTPGNTATQLVRNGIVRPFQWAPECSESLSIAAAFLVEATKHSELKDKKRSWTALLQCYYYCGMASGPTTNKERAAKGGRARDEPSRELRRQLLILLGKLPEASYKSVKAAIKDVMLEASKFADSQVRKSGVKARIGNGSSKSLERLFSNWSSTDKEVRKAFTRLVGREIKPGRPGKSAG